MQIEIPCEAYSRMVSIPLSIHLDDLARYPYIAAVYFERRNNTLFMVVTDVKIAAIENLGRDDGPDECTAIIANETLKNQCTEEQKYNGKVIITSTPFGTAIKTSFGWTFPGNGQIVLPDDHEFQRWRKWFPEEMPKKSAGVMRWPMDALVAIAEASPSGALIFPRNIDATKPMMVFDEDSSDWIGGFMPNHPSEEIAAPTYPEWMK